MPKGYIIGHVTVKNPDAYAEYVRLDTPIMERLGARFLVRGGRSEDLEGHAGARHLVFEFDSYEAARAAYFDPEYQDVMKIRHANAESVVVLVEGTE